MNRPHESLPRKREAPPAAASLGTSPGPRGSQAGSSPLRLGTRRSRLARTQSQWVADRLVARGHHVELVDVVTQGDVDRAPLASMGGTGVFAAALRQALLDGRVDLAVHSLKDLPTLPEPGLTIAAVPARADVRDALVARDGLHLVGLPAGAVVGTGSPRRAAQLAALGLGLQIIAIRGNVDTRIDLVRRGEVDAVVLARAGLQRLNRTDEITETLDPSWVLPAPGQGALAVEVREDDEQVLAAVRPLEDADARAAVTAERALLAALEAGCSAPVGALAEVAEDVDGSLVILLKAFAGAVDGSFGLRRSVTGPVARAADLGAGLASVLLEDGGDDLARLVARPVPAGRLPSNSPGDRRAPGPMDPSISRHVPTSAAEREK